GTRVLARRGARLPGNILLHQRAPVIVRASMQAKLRKPPVQLYPRYLDVVNRRRQHHPSQCVNLQMLRQRGPRTCQSLLEQQSVLMNESQQHELGKAASLTLYLAEQQQLVDPVLW